MQQAMSDKMNKNGRRDSGMTISLGNDGSVKLGKQYCAQLLQLPKDREDFKVMKLCGGLTYQHVQYMIMINLVQGLYKRSV